MIEIIEITGDFIRSGRMAGREGAEAYHAGEPIESCPHDDPYLVLQWRRAYVKAQYYDTERGKR